MIKSVDINYLKRKWNGWHSWNNFHCSGNFVAVQSIRSRFNWHTITNAMKYLYFWYYKKILFNAKSIPKFKIHFFSNLFMNWMTWTSLFKAIFFIFDKFFRIKCTNECKFDIFLNKKIIKKIGGLFLNFLIKKIITSRKISVFKVHWNKKLAAW